MSFDHKQPISQGGGLDFDNLAPACKECQGLKGELQEATFFWLLSILQTAGTGAACNTMPPLSLGDAKDLRKRLKGGAGFIFRKFPKKEPKKQDDYVPDK
jgi:hypothetical protein